LNTTTAAARSAATTASHQQRNGSSHNEPKPTRKARLFLDNLMQELTQHGYHGERTVRLVARDGVITNIEVTSIDKHKLI
jgi:hypothetical protein